MGIVQELFNALESFQESGISLRDLVANVIADDVVTDTEKAQLAMGLLDHQHAVDRLEELVEETGGTLQLIGTAAGTGISSAWLGRKATEHVRDMAGTVVHMS